MNRSDFPILDQQVHGRPLVYFDNAATSQKPQCVMDAITEAYTTWNANIHRGTHHLSQLATAKHEEARTTLAKFIGAEHSREILFTRGTTEGLNMLAFCFGEAFIHEGDEIIVSALEHHSNIVPWQMLCERKHAVLRVIPLNQDLTIDLSAFKQLLNTRTKLVSVAHVSNVLGIINPVEEIIRIAHEHGVPVCIDGAQSAPHLPVNVRTLDCDFFVCSAHKMYGPTGIGLLYGKQQWLEQLPPYQGGGEMIEHVRWSGTTYNELPYRFEAGTPDYVGSYAWGVAAQYMQDCGISSIAVHEQELTAYAEQQLSQIAGVRIYAAAQPKTGVLSFNIYDANGKLIHPFDLGALLDQQGIAVRIGHHCAEPLMDHLAIPGTVRISFALYNTREEIDLFIAALQRAIKMLA
ncbi:MAG: cysteine desulfurase [Paludibacteraceae bacterium]|nr:cysteine desulfurase [Paludibacteraceae bacterium]